ncbi:MAG: metallophosphoesterase [Terriglobia bacterium]
MSTSRMTNAFVRFLQKPIGGCVVGLLLVLALASPYSSSAAAPPERIVVVGDIHGGFDEFVALLQQAKLLDAQHRWRGGKATLVQTGDFLDRGPKSRQVMDLLMVLEKQARKKGGRVVVLLGNHEMMNLTGDLRYVSPEEYTSYSDEKSAERQKAAYQAHRELRKRRAQALRHPPPVFTPETEKEWMEKHPLGFVEHREALGPAGKYGRWLRQRPAVVEVGDVIFLHGGISPSLASWKVKEISNRIKQEIKAFDTYKKYLVKQKLILPFFTLKEMTAAARAELESRRAELNQKHIKSLEDFLGYGSWFSFHPEGPLWFRGFALWPEEVGASRVADLLAKLGATHFVVGHTAPMRDGRIHTRFDGRVFLVDTGMLAGHYPGGRASALEIQNGRFTAIYPNERVVLLDPAATSQPPRKEEVKDAAKVPNGEASLKQQEQPARQPPATSARVWLDPDGKPLPFTSDEEVLEFLRTARAVRMRELRGITRPHQVLLEKDGLRMHAIFHDIDVEKARFQGRLTGMQLGFRDTYKFQIAGYEMARLLGLDNVAPAIKRKLRGKSGSLAAWVENIMFDRRQMRERNIDPPDVQRWNNQMYIMHIFDALIENTDRTLENVLIDSNWKVWMIDHTRAFRRSSKVKNLKVISHCERNLWEKLRALDQATVKQRLKKLLRSSEIKALFKRRDKLVEYIQKLINERGEASVLYTLKE